ncbi:hypothetical protein DERP_006841 [Dermatophagoides pteronyssinus]|uniref:Uncharacterized protein n=1 Tax=Dermatophagoides pteronyssinus TaxID=6956 RepID=A0ABQ8IS61_DERPT|nr:hypothetical protein DERP_006841 [Dermatophagoides pteronyssinus]
MVPTGKKFFARIISLLLMEAKIVDDLFSKQSTLSIIHSVSSDRSCLHFSLFHIISELNDRLNLLVYEVVRFRHHFHSRIYLVLLCHHNSGHGYDFVSDYEHLGEHNYVYDVVWLPKSPPPLLNESRSMFGLRQSDDDDVDDIDGESIL